MIYRHAQSVRALLPPSTPEAAEARCTDAAGLLVQRATADEPLRRASSLPEYQPDEFEFDSHGASLMGEVLVAPDVYDRIRSTDQPLFSHIVGVEIGRDVAVDPEAGQTVAILDSWL